jgi:hypothetical protein
METKGIAILLLKIFPEFCRRYACMGLSSGGNCNRPYGSRAAQAKSVLLNTLAQLVYCSEYANV